MTKEERFSTITMTKKQKMPIHPPPTLRLEVGVFSAKKIKEKGLPETNWYYPLQVDSEKRGHLI
jgi:hypothetical protein